MTAGRSRTAPRARPRRRAAAPPGDEPDAPAAPGRATEAGHRDDGAPPIVPAERLPGTLADAVAEAGTHLRRLGVGHGDRVVLDATPRSRWDVLPYLLAADRIGAASLVADRGWSGRERAAVLADVAADLVVPVDGIAVPAPGAGGTGTAPGTAPPPHAPARRTTPLHTPAPGTEPPPHGPAAAPARTAVAAASRAPGPFLFPTTSGSTGTPTVLARTRRSWQLGFDALGALPGPVLVPGPPSSTLYLFGALHALHHRLGLVTRDRFHPADARAAGTVHLVPAQLSALLDEHERRPGPAPAVIVCGGAHVGPAVRERCTRLLPDTTLVEYYGSAEHSLIATRIDGGPLRPVDGVRLELRDGVLWVDTPQAVLGRLRDGVLEPAGAGATTVGDRAELGADGSLTVLGRASATISSGGALVGAEEVEQVLRAVPGVADVVVSGTPHPSLGMLVTAIVEPVPGATVTRRELRAAARDALSPAKRPRRWLVTAGLPRLGSGKPARAVVDAGLRDGGLDAVPFDAQGAAARRGTGSAPPNGRAAVPRNAETSPSPDAQAVPRNARALASPHAPRTAPPDGQTSRRSRR